MKKISIDVPAKLNLTLDILGVKKGFHQLNSLVTSLDIYDTITVNKRTDGKITLTMKGLKVDCHPHDNNAFKAASLFMQNYPTTGVDIVVNKRIPIGAGLGGSSADIAGVILALKALYGAQVDAESLAGAIGSDAAYMTKGGFAVLSGRGEQVRQIEKEKKYYVLLITEDKELLAGDCYKKYDSLKKKQTPTTKQAERALTVDDDDIFFQLIKNDLQVPAEKLVPEISFNLACMKKTGANAVAVAGSGPTVFGIFAREKDRDKGYKKLKPLFGKSLIKAETIPLSKDKR